MNGSRSALLDLAQSLSARRLDRRGLFKRAGALGVSVPTLTALLRGFGEAAAQETGSGGTLVFDLGSEPENLDPHQALAYTTSRLIEQTCEPLIYLGPETLDVNPWLAESWESSEDGLQWTFTLRQGVTFHDASDFNAEAVKFSFERQLKPDHPYFKLGQWSNASRLAFIEEIRVDAEHVVTFLLSEPYNKFLSRMANSPAGRIVSKQAVETHGDKFLENPVGTGPYAFDRWDKGQQVVLRRNEDYWGGRPSLDQVVFKAIAEDGARLAALLSGEVHMSLDVSAEIVERLRTSEDHTVISGPTGAVWFLAMNVESEPFQDVRVRQAVNYAVDKRAIVEDVLKGTVEIAYGPLSPAYQEFNPKLMEMYPFDPERARQLLEEANFPTDREVVFRSSIGGSGMLSPEEMATVIQDNLREVGMRTRLEVTEFVSWMDAIRNPQNELTVMSWNIPPIEPDTMFTGILTESALPPGFNTSYWVNEEFEQLIADARRALDPEVAKEKYYRAQEIVMEEAPIVPVCHRQQVYGVSNRVKNFSPNPSMELNLRQTYLEG